MTQKAVGTDLTQGNIMKILLLFALPIFFTNVIQQLYNIVDLAIIGQYVGDEGTVGVSVGGEIVELLTLFCSGFASGAQIYISQLAGANDKERSRETIGTLLTIMVGSAFVFMAVCLVFCEPILRLLNTPAAALGQAEIYMRITALGMPFIFGYNAICGVLRGMGESKRPLEFIIIAALSNVILDWILVAVFPLEAAGTAIATVMAQCFSCLAALIFLYRKRAHFNFSFEARNFAVKKAPLVILLKLGIPMGAQSTLIHFSQLYCNALVNKYGLIASTVNSIGNKVVRLANIITTSINSGTSAVVGQNMGAKKYDRVKSAVYCALAIAAALSLLNCVAALAIPRQVFRIFSKDAEVIEYGVIFLRISLITFILSAWMGPYSAVVSGSGNATLYFVMGLLDGVILRIGISLFMAYVLDFQLLGFWFGNALARLAPCAIATYYFYSGSWRRRKLLTA